MVVWNPLHLNVFRKVEIYRFEYYGCKYNICHKFIEKNETLITDVSNLWFMDLINNNDNKQTKQYKRKSTKQQKRSRRYYI
jgi:hypothetical protein